MASSSRTFKITCAAIGVLYKVHDSNLSGLRSNSIPIRHFLQPREVCAVKQMWVKACLGMKAMREIEIRMTKQKKMGFIGLEHHNHTAYNQIWLIVLHTILYTTHIDWELHHVYRLIPYISWTWRRSYPFVMYGETHLTVSLSQDIVSFSLSNWYPVSGVVLDCIDSWSLHPYLLWYMPL